MCHSQNYLSILISPSVLIFSAGTLLVKSKVMMVESWVSARQGYSQTWWGSRAIPWLFSLLIPSFFSFEPCIETKKSVDLRLNNNTFWVLKIQPNAAEGRGGAGRTSYDGLYGEAPPERGIFFKLQVYERLEILLVEVYKWVWKSVIWVCERAQNMITHEFYGVIKSRKRSIFVSDSYLTHSAFTAVTKDVKF